MFDVFAVCQGKMSDVPAANWCKQWSLFYGVEVWSPSSGDDLILRYVNAHFKANSHCIDTRRPPRTITRLQYADKRRFSMFKRRKQAPTDANTDPTKPLSSVGAVWIGLSLETLLNSITISYWYINQVSSMVFVNIFHVLLLLYRSGLLSNTKPKCGL